MRFRSKRERDVGKYINAYQSSGVGKAVDHGLRAYVDSFVVLLPPLSE